MLVARVIATQRQSLSAEPESRAALRSTELNLCDHRDEGHSRRFW